MLNHLGFLLFVLIYVALEPLKTQYGPQHEIYNNVVCATNKGSDQAMGESVWKRECGRDGRESVLGRECERAYERERVWESKPRSILVFSGRYHIMSNASIVNNCFII